MNWVTSFYLFYRPTIKSASMKRENVFAVIINEGRFASGNVCIHRNTLVIQILLWSESGNDYSIIIPFSNLAECDMMDGISLTRCETKTRVRLIQKWSSNSFDFSIVSVSKPWKGSSSNSNGGFLIMVLNNSIKRCWPVDKEWNPACLRLLML